MVASVAVMVVETADYSKLQVKEGRVKWGLLQLTYIQGNMRHKYN